MPLLPHYIHIINPKLKHTYLTFNDEGDLVIKSPKVSQKYVERLILKKSSWINSSLQKLALKKGKRIFFSQDAELYYLGEPYTLRLVTHEKKRTKLTFDGSSFILYYSVYDENIFQKHIDTFYKQESLKYVPKLVDKWSQTMKLNVGNINFRKTKRQWGSCSAKNNLSFNTMIMKLPPDVIQYIIIHELSHIRYKHHQKSFWSHVESYLPKYKLQIKELKKFTT